MKKAFRLLLILFVLNTWAAISEAQVRRVRIGILGAPEEPRFSEMVDGLKQGLRDLGYSERAVEILEGRVGRGDQASTLAAVEGFVHQRADVIFLIGSRFVKMVRQVSSEIPIVFITPGDPVAAGLLSSLARPGGNMTAISFEYPELSAKRLELLKEMAPRVRRVLVLYDPRDPSPPQSVESARAAAPELGITLVERVTRTPEEITRGLETLSGVDAFLAIPGGIVAGHYGEIIRSANAKRRPTMFHVHTKGTAEALASYGTSDANIAHQAARLVDKILKGAKAGGLPVERPMRFTLVINLKTAKALGLTIPRSVLIRADDVIE